MASSTTSVRAILPDVWELVRPRRGLLLAGLGVMVINRASSLVLPASTKFLIDDVIGKSHTERLLPLLAAVLIATMVQGATSFALTQMLSKAAHRLIAELRQKLQAHIGRLPITFYDANKTGTLVSRIMSDVEGIRNLIGTGLVEFLGGLLTAVFAFLVLIGISPLLTGITVAFLAVFGLALRKSFGKVRPIFRERSKIQAEVTGRLTESLGGARVVKGYHAESREAAVFSRGAHRLLDNVLQSLTAISVMSLSASVLLGTVGAVIMYAGARQVLSGAITLGEFVTFTAFLAFLVAPVFQVVQIGTQITEALAGLERSREIFKETPEDRDPRRTLAIGPAEGRVEFQDVTFEYTPGKPVLHGISFVSEPGTVTALVGSSGSGKSTITGLIAAFHKPTGGSIRLDGVDLSTVQLSSYRPQLGVVLQDTFLFDGTVKENVAFGRPDASEADIVEACRIARVDEFAQALEHGYDTIVGERGVKLSGGQRQRVAIARAILADPRILILDEATSSLDTESEAMIQQGLAHLMRGRTTFVIAHRLSTIRRAEQILVVEAGRIVERGTHQTLFAAKGRYWELYMRQHGLESNLFLADGEGDTVPDEITA